MLYEKDSRTAPRLIRDSLQPYSTGVFKTVYDGLADVDDVSRANGSTTVVAL